MPISPPPVGRWLPEYIPAYLSNGVIGLRAGPIPLIEGVAIVNGLAAIDPVEKGEGLARAPYPIGGDLEVDGAELSRRPGQAVLVEQHYDFACGELSSRFSFHPTDATATVDVLTFCSRSLPSVVLQEVQVRVDRPCSAASSSCALKTVRRGSRSGRVGSSWSAPVNDGRRSPTLPSTTFTHRPTRRPSSVPPCSGWPFGPTTTITAVMSCGTSRPSPSRRSC